MFYLIPIPYSLLFVPCSLPYSLFHAPDYLLPAPLPLLRYHTEALFLTSPIVDQMIKLLGQGTFGKVVQAKDKRRNKLVAIKIIRSVQKYRDASKIELRVLATLKANDEENRNRCIHLRDCFDYRGHICIVMDLLGQSVFDFLKSNNFVPFPNSQIQNFARQLFTSVACEYSPPIRSVRARKWERRMDMY